MDRRRIQRSRKTARGRSTSRSLSTSFTDGGTGGRNERRLRGASAKLQTSILLFPVVIEYPKSTRDPWTRYLDHVHWEVEKTSRQRLLPMHRERTSGNLGCSIISKRISFQRGKLTKPARRIFIFDSLVGEDRNNEFLSREAKEVFLA